MFKINSTVLPDPKEWRPVREYIYAGEYTSQTGKQFADIVGWRYAPATLAWEVLQQSEMDAILAAGSQFTITFTDPKDGEVTTQARLVRFGTTHRRNYWGDRAIWTDFSVEVIFTDAYTD